MRGELITPNPKLKLLDQVREVMELKHYSLRTERCYADWMGEGKTIGRMGRMGRMGTIFYRWRCSVPR